MIGAKRRSIKKLIQATSPTSRANSITWKRSTNGRRSFLPQFRRKPTETKQYCSTASADIEMTEASEFSIHGSRLVNDPTVPACSAREELDRRSNLESHILTNAFYAGCLALRSLPVSAFLGGAPSKWPLPITSINEDRLLKELGVSLDERNQIEGLQAQRTSRENRRLWSSSADQPLASHPLVRLAANPPPEVGIMQQRTCRGWLVRPFPLGLRFSGSNLTPLPGWMAGCHSIA